MSWWVCHCACASCFLITVGLDGDTRERPSHSRGELIKVYITCKCSSLYIGLCIHVIIMPNLILVRVHVQCILAVYTSCYWLMYGRECHCLCMCVCMCFSYIIATVCSLCLLLNWQKTTSLRLLILWSITLCVIYTLYIYMHMQCVYKLVMWYDTCHACVDTVALSTSLLLYFVQGISLPNPTCIYTCSMYMYM